MQGRACPQVRLPGGLHCHACSSHWPAAHMGAGERRGRGGGGAHTPQSNRHYHSERVCVSGAPRTHHAGYGCDGTTQCCPPAAGGSCAGRPQCTRSYRLPSSAWGCSGGAFNPVDGPLTQWGWSGYRLGRQQIPTLGQVRLGCTPPTPHAPAPTPVSKHGSGPLTQNQPG